MPYTQSKCLWIFWPDSTNVFYARYAFLSWTFVQIFEYIYFSKESFVTEICFWGSMEQYCSRWASAAKYLLFWGSLTWKSLKTTDLEVAFRRRNHKTFSVFSQCPEPVRKQYKVGHREAFKINKSPLLTDVLHTDQ